ncbi:MAG: hypothetical protein OXI30_03155 [Chloroflexota bacterium]|nr:hypothetical protein [Chloroflexota bacterium]
MSHVIGSDLGGSVALAGDLLLDAARASLKQYSFRAACKSRQVDCA